MELEKEILSLLDEAKLSINNSSEFLFRSQSDNFMKKELNLKVNFLELKYHSLLEKIRNVIQSYKKIKESSHIEDDNKLKNNKVQNHKSLKKKRELKLNENFKNDNKYRSSPDVISPLFLNSPILLKTKHPCESQIREILMKENYYKLQNNNPKNTNHISKYITDKYKLIIIAVLIILLLIINYSN
jgi:hypothetical protein